MPYLGTGDCADAEWLRLNRHARGLKQQQVAARLGEINGGRISEWENGKKPIPQKMKKALEDLFKN